MQARAGRHHSRAFRFLVTAPSILLAAYFILWACAPPAALPPVVPMAADQHNEVGLGYAVGTASDTVINNDLGSVGLPPWHNAQLWYYHQFQRELDLGVQAFGGYYSLGGLGLMVRHHFVRRPAFQLSGELQFGFLYGAVGLPMSFALHDRVWVSFSPSIGWRMFAPLRVPVGLSLKIAPNLLLHTELGVGTGRIDNMPWLDTTYYHGALGLAARF